MQTAGRRRSEEARDERFRSVAAAVADGGTCPTFRRALAGAFEAALASQDAARIGALFHQDSHWRDVLAFTWHMTPLEGRENVAARLAAEQEHTAAHGFHLPPGRKPPRKVRRLGIDSIEAIFEFTTATAAAPASSAFHRHRTPAMP